jgi:hypothetical protein
LKEENAKQYRQGISPLVLIAVVTMLVMGMGLAVSARAQTDPLLLTLRSVPCRLADTRVSGGTIAPNEIRIFSVEQGFSPLQGGAPATEGCFVPPSTRAVKLNVKGMGTETDAGYFRVFNADASSLGVYSSLQLQIMGRWVAIQLDVPVGGNLLVAIHSLVRAHSVVDLVGYYE